MIDSEQHSRISPEVNPKLGANIGKKLKLKSYNLENLLVF